MGSGTTKCQHSQAINLKDFPAHKVQHIGPQLMHSAAVPFLDGKAIEQWEIFVISVNKNEGLRFLKASQASICLIYRQPKTIQNRRKLQRFHHLSLDAAALIFLKSEPDLHVNRP